jgi:hypothetical protein
VPKRTQAVTDAELAVMKVLWATSPLPVRAIAGRIYPKCTESEVGTVDVGREDRRRVDGSVHSPFGEKPAAKSRGGSRDPPDAETMPT